MTPQLSHSLQKLLAGLPQSDRLAFEQIWQVIYQTRFDGPVTFHCRGGVPHQVDLGSPVKLSICQGLDNRPGRSADSQT